MRIVLYTTPHTAFDAGIQQRQEVQEKKNLLRFSLKWYVLHVKINSIHPITSLNTELTACRRVPLLARYSFSQKSNICNQGKFMLIKKSS